MTNEELAHVLPQNDQMKNRARFEALKARATAQGMSVDEFGSVVRRVNDRAMASASWGSLPERLDAIENALRIDAEYHSSHRYMK